MYCTQLYKYYCINIVYSIHILYSIVCILYILLYSMCTVRNCINIIV